MIIDTKKPTQASGSQTNATFLPAIDHHEKDNFGSSETSPEPPAPLTPTEPPKNPKSYKMFGLLIDEDFVDAAGDINDQELHKFDNLAPKVFETFNAGLREAANTAYPLSLKLLRAEPALVKEFLKRPIFADRNRSLPVDKVALAAMQYVAGAKDEDQRKTCSDYAALLVYAAHRKVEPTDFLNEMRKVTLKAAKVYIRDRRREAKPKPKDPPPERLVLKFKGNKDRKGISIAIEARRRPLRRRLSQRSTPTALSKTSRRPFRWRSVSRTPRRK